ncbi:LINE-1 retrotransposable element ORF2 protein [Symbiodinium microadriaticum]|uniref:LINE-1 retrotransposable element ORF2 protein n=1 Tax=Symbiodinium microadriaticum TaxID=2951 RepID=A0A1Q9CVX3_SYMMI|nr:LINE-1 retrotransposable element ORF2 protein [Symbiodinium microadriaticum]
MASGDPLDDFAATQGADLLSLALGRQPGASDLDDFVEFEVHPPLLPRLRRRAAPADAASIGIVEPLVNQLPRQERETFMGLLRLLSLPVDDGWFSAVLLVLVRFTRNVSFQPHNGQPVYVSSNAQYVLCSTAGEDDKVWLVISLDDFQHEKSGSWEGRLWSSLGALAVSPPGISLDKAPQTAWQAGHSYHQDLDGKPCKGATTAMAIDVCTTGLRTPRDAMVAVAMEADASEASMPAETVVMTGTSGGEASSVGGGTAPMTPTRTSTAISGNSMGTPLRINRKQGAYFSHGLRSQMLEHKGHTGAGENLCIALNLVQAVKAKDTYHPGGLMDTRYQEVLAWPAAEAQAGHPVDILTLQETCWKQDMEYRTACGPTDEAYHVVHSAGGDKSGIMIMIRQGLLPAHDIQYVPLVPGRAVHLRLRFPTPMDILCLYQVSWNVTKSTLEGHKVTALLKQRARIWRQVEQWLRATPGRHGCLLVGDLNTPLTPEPGVCGPVPLVQNIAQQDQAELQAILRTHACCALNSWTGTGAQARTFIPPKGDPALQGTRIDFVIARGSLIDHEAKQAGVISAPFVPACGARHKPVQAKIRFPTPPKSGNHPGCGRQPAQVCKQLRDPRLEAGLATHLSTLLAQSAPEDDLDEILLQGWAMARPGPPGHHRRHEPAPQQNLTVRHRIQHMWQLRASLRRTQPHVDTEGDLPSLASIWKAWIQVARLQACTRQLRKDCRQHKTLKIFEAVQADNIYTAAKKFAPRQARRRLQLRTKDGQLMSHEQEFQCIKDYFKGLYRGPNPQQVILSQAVQFEPAEVRAAILKLSAGKAMPQHSAPAALWRKSVDQVASRLCSQLNNCLQLGCRSLPPRWSTSDMALIPKPGKAMTSPEQLRPISLLPMPAKALGSMLAERLHEHAYRYLQGIPQYAYMKGRHLGMALDRVASHCISIRRLLHDQANTLHARRSGRRVAQVCGGCMLSLDLSKAYDHVPWEDLATALRDAEVPMPLVELVLLLHQQARIRVAHHAQWELLNMHRGLRQGCSLAPALWIFYSGWLLKGLHATGEVDIPASNTSYADDFHFCWQVLQASDMERSYRAMRAVLQGLEEKQVQVSFDKTVAIIDLQGPGARKCLDRYLVRRPRCEGLFLKFMIAGEARYVQVKTRHTYLGVSISYKKPEQETATLRLDLATGTFRRLKKILTCRDVPLKLRLQLWQGTVIPTMLHGLDSVGLPPKEASQLMTWRNGWD